MQGLAERTRCYGILCGPRVARRTILSTAMAAGHIGPALQESYRRSARRGRKRIAALRSDTTRLFCASPQKNTPLPFGMREFCSRSYFGAVLTDPFPCIRKTVLCQPAVLYPPVWTSGSSVSSFVRLASGDQSLISLPLSLNVVSSVRLASGDMSMILL